MDEQITTTTTTELLEGTLEVMGGTCYPTHHDYQSVSDGMGGPLLMFCRLCGDVRSIELDKEDLT